MNYNVAVPVLIAFMIAGISFPNIHFSNDQAREYTGYGLFVGFVFATVGVLYNPISQNRNLRKHLLIRLSVLIFCLLAIFIAYQTLSNGGDRLGAAYLLVFLSGGTGILLGTYALIETTYLFIKKKTEKAIVNLFLAWALYSFAVFVFGGLFR